MPYFRNENNDSPVSGTSTNDYIYNLGSNVTISVGSGDDDVFIIIMQAVNL